MQKEDEPKPYNSTPSVAYSYTFKVGGRKG
jgi:hypothetical protein